MNAEIEKLQQKDRLTIDDARWILGEATRRLVPVGDLVNWWDGYETVATAFANSEMVCARSMIEMRNGLEYVKCDEGCGEGLIAASKMVLSALGVFTSNPIGSLYLDQDLIHDAIDPLIQKAVMILGLALVEMETLDAGGQPYRVPIEFDHERPARLKAHQDRNRLEYLLENAVRPSEN